jgi:hypothetical protein
MQALKEDDRNNRRTVADALEVIRQEFGVDETPGAEISVGPLLLPSGEATAAVVLVCPDLECCVSLPASWWFTAFPERSSRRRRFEISHLDKAKVGPTGSVVLTDGRSIRGVEMVPTHMPYELSWVEKRILWNVVQLTASHGCYRNLREDLPQHLQPGGSGPVGFGLRPPSHDSRTPAEGDQGIHQKARSRTEGFQPENCRRARKMRGSSPKAASPGVN